ncbi:MAG: DUF4236 domain-containing protein [Betaproteobacteria bacterium]|nr:DUF4236 domain-containing protein [Betaproteobacteria bacterium]
MALRFRKTLSLLPAVRLNVSKSGVSLTIGRRGATVTIGRQGVTGGVGLPGTGISYRTRLYRWFFRDKS